MTGTFRLGRRPALDGLRGVAVLLVVVGHSVAGFDGLAPAGVTIFFVLSGFLITRLLVEEHERTGRIDRSAFLARRARRILPALVPLLALAAAWSLTEGRSLRPVLLVATFTANLAGPLDVGLGWLAHTWSLALEEQFYLLWPLLVVPFARHRLGRWALAGAALASAAARLWLVQSHTSGELHGFRPDVRADAIIIGCLLALVIDRAHEVRRLPLLAALSTLVLAWGVTASDWPAIARMLLPAALAAAALVAWATSRAPGPLTRVLAWQPLRFTGRISYGMYLWQAVVAAKVLGSVPPGWAATALVLIGSYAAATISWYVIERPFLRPPGQGVTPSSSSTHEADRREAVK